MSSRASAEHINRDVSDTRDIHLFRSDAAESELMWSRGLFETGGNSTSAAWTQLCRCAAGCVREWAGSSRGGNVVWVCVCFFQKDRWSSRWRVCRQAEESKKHSRLLKFSTFLNDYRKIYTTYSLSLNKSFEFFFISWMSKRSDRRPLSYGWRKTFSFVCVLLRGGHVNTDTLWLEYA